MSLAFAMLLPAGITALTPADLANASLLPGAAGADLWDILDKLDRTVGVETSKFLVPELYDLEPSDVLAMERSLLKNPSHEFPGLLRLVPPGSTEDYTGGELHITENWDIEGTVNINGVSVIFDCACVITVKGTGTLSITGATTIKDNDNDPLTVKTIVGPGTILIEGTSSTPIKIKSVTVALLARGPSNDATNSKVRWTQFSDARIGLQANNSKALLEFNTFSNLGTAFFHIPRGLGFTGAGNATISNSSFVGNQRGVFYQASATSNIVGSSGGRVQFSEFKANQFGVLCVGTGADEGSRPTVFKNNFRNSYAEAYSGFRGVTVDVPPPGPSPGDVSVNDGDCLVDNNFFATGESQFFSNSDTNSNNQNSAIANSAPANPLTPRVVTGTETIALPHTLTGPLIADDGSHLTIKNGEIDVDGFLWGSGTGGELITDDLTVKNNGQLLIRNDGDDVDGLIIRGKAQRFPLFAIGANNMHALLWRNSAVMDGWDVKDYDHAMTWTSGVLVDTEIHTPEFLNGKLVNGALGAGIALFGNFAKARITATTIENVGTASRGQLGTTTIADSTFKQVSVGASGGLAQQITSDDNDYLAAGIGLTVAATGTGTSTNDVFDGGLIGVRSILAAPTTITGAVISQFNLGVLNLVGGSFTVTGSTFAYNAYAVVPIADTITVTNGNFRDNYQHSLFSVPADPLVTGTIVAANINCNNCFFYRDDDDSRSNGGKGAITVTEALAANSNPNPSWLSDVVIAGPGETKSVSGTLKAPAIARDGGRLRVEDAFLDGLDRFALGAKTGGNGQGATGHVTIRNSTLTNVPFFAVNSSNSRIENNVFTSSREQIELTTRGMTLECNKFDRVSLPVQWMRQNLSLPDLTFRRNLITNGGGLDLGLADTDEQRTTLTGNGYYNGFSFDGLYDRFAQGGVTMSDNNLVSHTGAAERGVNPEQAPVQANVEGNWWNSATGPTVSNNAGGTGTRIYREENPDLVVNKAPIPDWDPFLTAAVKPALCLQFRFDPASPTEIQSATFTDLSFAPSGSAIAKRTWNFGDGTGDIVDTTDDVMAHDFTDGGSYSVKLTVETADGQTGSITKSITVAHVNPAANFVSAVVNEITPVAFTDTSTHPNTPQDDPPTGWTYAWDFNGEGSSTARNPSFRFPDGGSKNVKLTVKDNDGLTNEVTNSINVPHVKPVADFAVTGTLETDTYQLTDTSTHPNAPTDGIVSRAWSCSDGFTSTAANPAHKFADGGTYSCTLTVTDNDAQSDSVTKSISVAHVAPVAAFTNGAASELEAMAFTDTSTHPNAPTDAPPAGWAYAWDFGDGAASSDRNPSHDYADGGTYAVQLTATDNDGQGSTVGRSVTVTHVPPVAKFSFSPANPEDGETVTFTDLSTHPNAPVDSLAAWAWDFGDGATSALQNPTHVYAADGNYDAKLCGTDDDGLSACITIRVPVGNIPPIAAFTHSPENPTDLDTVQFTDQSSDPDGTVVSWAWDFGDGSTSTAQNPSHKFADNGLYTVSLKVTDNLGATTTVSEVIEVLNVGPTASFTYGPGNPQVNEDIQFADTSTDPDGTIASRLWDFGDGTTSTEQDPVHSYAEGGDYVVSITVTDDDGATATTQQTVHVCETQINLDGSGPLLEFCLRIEL